MTHEDLHARTRATVGAHSLLRTLLVAVLLSVAPLAAAVVLTAGGLGTAFLAGAATGAVVTVLRRRSARSSRRRAGDRRSATRAVEFGG